MIYKILFFMIACILVISCSNEQVPIGPKPAIKLSDNYWKNSAPLSSGVNYNTGEEIVVNNLTGEEVQPCKDGSFIGFEEETAHDIKQNTTESKKSEDTDCGIKAVDLDPKLRTAIEASHSVINGTVMKGGKKVPAKFVVQITAVYEGSICTTIQNGGNQYTTCLKETNFCKLMYNNRYNATRWYVKRFGPRMSNAQIKQLVIKSLPPKCKRYVR